VVAAAVRLTAVVCEACGSSVRNGAAGVSEWGLLPIGGDDEANGSVLASGWGEKRWLFGPLGFGEWRDGDE
jgi:hypothetical protein